MLIDYKLADPITRLTLLIQRQPTKPTLKPTQALAYHIINNGPLYSALQLVSNNMSRTANDLTWADYRDAIYELANGWAKHNDIDEAEDVTNWTGEYYPELGSVLLNPHHDGIYYLQFDTKQQKLFVYHTDYDESDQIGNLILYQSRNLRFAPDLNAFDALKNFWFIQSDIQSAIQHDVEHENQISSSLMAILSHVLDNQSQSRKISNKLAKRITYQKLLDFYQEIQAQKLTAQTMDVQNWLLDSSHTVKDVQALLDIFKHHEHYATFLKSIGDPLTFTAAKDIINEFKKDKYFAKYEHLAIHIYPIQQPQKKYQNGSGKVHHFLGVHGTQAYSIPSILCDGLKSMHELKHDADAEYQETAQSLGDGTYFARLDQVSKSLNYSSSHQQHQYLLITDISYTKPVTVDTYGNINSDDYDFVKAVQVGISHGYDEFVAVNPQAQTQIKYLVEIG